MKRRGDAIEVVRGRVDIVDLVGSYLPLKRTGANFKALCPFHDEKSASFTVSPTRQTYHCFGCGERGGVFDFVMRQEQCEFRDALEILAQRAGISLEDFEPEDGEAKRARGRKARLLELHAWAAEFFREHFAADGGSVAREYLEGRDLKPETVTHFGLGAAPEGWTGLVDEARKAGFGEQELQDGGLGLPGVNRPGLYDRFRGRLMFPIRDGLGRDIAFGARTLDGTEPKYLNSPETELFHKGRTLFAIDDLKGHPREEPVLVMEGYTDVLMSWQHGVRGAVATLGTALTPEHARLLRRYADTAVLVYDGDPAGLKAAERGAQLLLEAGHVDLQVVVLPTGQDPCDFFSARGADGIEDLVALRQPLLEFLIARAGERHDIGTLEGRRQAAEGLLTTAVAITDRVTRELVLERVGERLRISRYALEEGVAQRRDRARRAPAARTEAAAPNEEAPADLRRRVQRDIAQAYLNEPDLFARHAPGPWVQHLQPAVAELLERLQEIWDGGIEAPGALVDHLEDEKQRGMARRLLLPDEHGQVLGAQLQGAIHRLNQLRVEDDVSRHKEGGSSSDLEEIQRLMRERKGRPAE